jgi:hypothetical protein
MINQLNLSKKTKKLLEELIICPEILKWDLTSDNELIIKFK